MRLIAFIVLSVISVSPVLSRDNTDLLRDEYVKFKDSMLNSEFQFGCGVSIFKLERKIFRGESLYWKSRLGWEKMNKLKLKSGGLSFEGLGLKGGVPKTRLNVSVSLPMYNIVKGYPSSLDYFTLKENNIYIPYRYVVDFYSGKLIKNNMVEIVDILEMDSAVYIQNQRNIKEFSSDLSVSDFDNRVIRAEYDLNALKIKKKYSYNINKDKDIDRKIALATQSLVDAKVDELSRKKKKKEKEKSAEQFERDSSIREAIRRYRTPIEVITKIHEYSNTSDCYTIE